MTEEYFKKVKFFVQKCFGDKYGPEIFEHFESTVRWLKILQPGADVAMQIAAYAHDLGRAFTPGIAYQPRKKIKWNDAAYLKKHQLAGAKGIQNFLIKIGFNQPDTGRVFNMVNRHEVGGDQESDIIKDADSLSYLEKIPAVHLNLPDKNRIKEKLDWMYNRITSKKAKKIAKPIYQKAMQKLGHTKQKEADTIKQTLIQAVSRAGEELLKRFGQIKHSRGMRKSKHETVTSADMVANRIILKAIKNKFPKHGIISEESRDENLDAEFVWCIDPLDGTTNFSMGNPLFAVSVAVFQEKKLFISAIYVPYLKEFYFAQNRKGAFLIKGYESKDGIEKMETARRIKTSQKNRVSDSICTYCFGYDEKIYHRMEKIEGRMRRRFEDARLLGTAAIELAWAAAGRTEAMVVPAARIWDVAAGILLVREAGGEVTDFKGKEWVFNSQDVVATNGKIHSQILKLINHK